MFDWAPKKTPATSSAQKAKDGSPADLDELFADNTDMERRRTEGEAVMRKDAVPMKPKKTVKAPAIPNDAQKPPATSQDRQDELTLIEPSIIMDRSDFFREDDQVFLFGDDKTDSTTASSGQSGSANPSENWDYPDVLGFLNDIDAQTVFKPLTRNMKPATPSYTGNGEGEPTGDRTPLPRSVMTNAAAAVKNNEEDEDELIAKLIKGRFPYHSGKDNFEQELKASSSPYINAFMDTRDAPPTMIVDDFGDRSLWELQLNNSNLPGMELEEFSLINFDHIYINEMRRGFKRARRDFIKFVSYNNQQDLYAAGLDDTDLAMLRKGYVCENFNVHRKVPYEYGGTNDFSNLCLIQTHPYHDNLHKFLDMQVFIHPKGAKVKHLFIPIPSGNVYVPYLDIAGSGGKSKHDRSVYAGFHKEMFDIIAQKTSMGKAADL